MAALFHHPPLIKHYNLIRINNRLQNTLLRANAEY